jgi:hypothetical protein
VPKYLPRLVSVTRGLQFPEPFLTRGNYINWISEIGYGGMTSYSNSLILRWARHDIEAMSGATNTASILLKIGGVEGTYRSIPVGKSTRKTILKQNINED